MDTTLALIILPLLKQYEHHTPGYPSAIDKEDLPKDFVNPFSMDAWYYLLDEMIFAFDFINREFEMELPKNDDGTTDFEKYNEENARVNNGCRLFGKYYRHLWE